MISSLIVVVLPVPALPVKKRDSPRNAAEHTLSCSSVSSCRASAPSSAGRVGVVTLPRIGGGRGFEGRTGTAAARAAAATGSSGGELAAPRGTNAGAAGRAAARACR